MARILVIDDDRAVQGVLVQALIRAGHDAAGADDGKAGLEAYRAEPADLVIADLFMPVMEGIEFIRRLRGEFSDATIVAMSGGDRFPKRDLLEVSRELGACQILPKPFTTDQLLQVVEEVLEERTRA